MLNNIIWRLALVAVAIILLPGASAQTIVSQGQLQQPRQIAIPYPPPRFRTWKTNPGYYKPDYPIVFVSSYRDPSLNNSGNFGTDVLQIGAPQAGQELWILLPNGNAKKLFPIQGVHDGDVDATLQPEDDRIIGAVIEPSISIDGKRVLFTYFADAKHLPSGCCGSVGHSNFEGWTIGGHGYSIDLSPLLANFNFSPANLELTRLTSNDPNDITKHAMNPALATLTGPFPAGVSYSGFTEIAGAYGPQLLFSSTRALLGNSNVRMTKKNKNYNLYTADFNYDAAEPLSNIKQAHYFTTTSAISPNRLRTGYSFSYQANTEDSRQWHIQQVIGHKWTPLFGYGSGNELAHLATLCVKSQSSPSLPAGDLTVVAKYYNQNNNAFGALFALPMANAGLNTYDNQITNGKVPEQFGAVKITQNVVTGDTPSNNGKFTTPGCGGPDELYAAYDPGIANHKNSPYDYQPHIVFTDLEAADPGQNPGAYKKVIKGWNGTYAALWPKPVIDWSQRLTGTPHPTGNAQQDMPPSPIDNSLAIGPGAPYAVIGTSSLYNTDVTPVDCRASIGYFDPFVVGDAKVDPLYNNIAGLTRLMAQGPGDIANQTGSCTPPGMRDVFGVAIYMTSNRLSEEQFTTTKRGYTTDNSGGGGGTKESKRLLGVFKVGQDGRPDASFKATVPANVPLDFHLLDINGVKLADVQSWHSLKPREERSDCGGCHNHRPGGGQAWSPASFALPPVDMAEATSTIEYNAQCQPDVVPSTEPTAPVPVWQELSAEFNTQCGSCHEQGSMVTNARNAFDYDAGKLNAFNNDGSPQAGNPLLPLFARKYINRYGANASPMFWAAKGERTDGRNNNLPEYQPDMPDFSTCSNGDREKCGFVYTASHDGLPTCNGNDPDGAKWVYELSQWIDNHAPVDVPGKPQQYEADRYHPTVESAFVPNGTDCANTPLSLDIGFWDDAGEIVELDVDLNGGDYFEVTNPALLQNGMVSSTNLHGTNVSNIAHFLLAVTAVDAAGNRQTYEKTVDELIKECQAAL